MRLFFAIEPTEHVRVSLADVLTRAALTLGSDGAALRWTTSENLHLTLQFLGEVERDRLGPLVGALQPGVPLRPFAVSLDRFGAFPPSGPPRTIWLGVGKASTRSGRSTPSSIGASDRSVSRRSRARTLRT